jgi:hypothetical protein
MRYRWSALLFVLALVLMPRVGSAQSGQKSATPALGQNFPNPFNPETRIPFTVGDFPTCSAGSQLHKVTLRIYNILSQLVKVPVLEGGTGSVAGGQPLQNVSLPCGQYHAYWDGNYLNTSQEVASGVYMFVLEIDGKRAGVVKALSVK